MTKFIVSILGLGLVAFLSGCANFTSVHHEFSSDSFDANDSAGKPRVKSVSVDAQQRFLVMNFAEKMWKVCAEPSPDALSALSGGGGASLSSKSDAAASLAASFAQQAAAFGLRTQSITTLRDEAFRLCEGFANGALTKRTFDVLHRRFLNNMVAELAIEQLTGYARPTVVTLGGGATGTSGGGLPQAQTALDDANKQRAAKQDDAKAADKSLADAHVAYSLTAKEPADAAVLDQAKANQRLAADAVAEAKKNVDALTTARNAARSVTSGATSSPAQFSVPVGGTPITADVANAVYQIVHDVIFRDYTKDNCIDFLSDSTDSNAKSRSTTSQECINLLNALTADLKRATAREQGCMDYLFKSPGTALDSGVKKMCIDLLTSAATNDNNVAADGAPPKASAPSGAGAKADSAGKSAAAGPASEKSTVAAASTSTAKKATIEAAKKAAVEPDATTAKVAAERTAPVRSSLPKKSNASDILEKYNQQ